jgi:hypothetical protein
VYPRCRPRATWVTLIASQSAGQPRARPIKLTHYRILWGNASNVYELIFPTMLLLVSELFFATVPPLTLLSRRAFGLRLRTGALVLFPAASFFDMGDSWFDSSRRALCR